MERKTNRYWGASEAGWRAGYSHHMTMKTTLKFEEAMMFTLSLLFFQTQDFSWTWFAILFLAPDLGMLGYLVNAKTGAITYNTAHHKGLAILIYLSGIYFSIPQLQ